MRAIVTAPASGRICSGRSSSPGVVRFFVIPGEFPSCRGEGGWVEVVWAFTVARRPLPMRSQWQKLLLQLLIKLLDGQACIEYLEAIFAGHLLVLLKHQRLVIHKAIKEIFSQFHIHARFPVIEATALQHAWYQIIDTHL